LADIVLKAAKKFNIDEKKLLPTISTSKNIINYYINPCKKRANEIEKSIN
jgi:hypothetical protein